MADSAQVTSHAAVGWYFLPAPRLPS